MTGTPTATAAGGNGKPLVPANAKFRGMYLEEWSVLYGEWFVGNDWGPGTDIPDTVNKMRLLPAAGQPGDHVREITVKTGTGFVLPPMFIFGELYLDGSSDDPDFVFPDADWAVDPNLGPLVGINVLDYFYMTTHTEFKLNGAVILSGVTSGMEERHYGPVYFDSPIPYDEVAPNGAVAAAWTFGVGAVFTPLPRGTHTLELTTEYDNIFFVNSVFHFVYTINVTK
jgi:hypothetical protein